MSLTESHTSSIAAAWDRFAVTYQNGANLPTDVISYGPDSGTEADYRLLGPLAGKRFLDLGCGGGQSAIAAAKQSAIAIGVDISVEQLAIARRLIEQEEVRVELKQGDLAELAFQRADSVDIVFSAWALQFVPDLNRVFRQIHRVLRPQGTFVFSIPHPVVAPRSGDVDEATRPNQLSLEPEVFRIEQSYFDSSPIEYERHGIRFTAYKRPVAEIFMGLIRSGYRVDVILEPELPSGMMVPRILIMRARKEA